MRKHFIIFFGLIVLFSLTKCIFPEYEFCEVKTELSVPQGYKIKLASSILYNGTLRRVQFVTENVGYILGTNNVWGLADVFKTTDGGTTWEMLTISANQIPISMYFINEQVGFITYDAPKANLLVTTNGGLTWNTRQYDDLSGRLYHIQSDSQGNLYALLTQNEPILVKSTDQAQSWQVIYDDPKIGFSLITFSFRVFGDRIYISGDNRTMVVTDLEGNEQQTLQTGVGDIFDFEIIDNQNIFISGSQSLVYTTNGGTTWQTAYNGRARIIGFTDASNGLAILNKGYCQTDTYQSSDVFAFTQSGGVPWIEGNEITNLISYYSDVVKLSNNCYLIILGNNLYKIEKE